MKDCEISLEKLGSITRVLCILLRSLDIILVHFYVAVTKYLCLGNLQIKRFIWLMVVVAGGSKRHDTGILARHPFAVVF